MARRECPNGDGEENKREAEVHRPCPSVAPSPPARLRIPVKDLVVQRPKSARESHRPRIAISRTVSSEVRRSGTFTTANWRAAGHLFVVLGVRRAALLGPVDVALFVHAEGGPINRWRDRRVS